MFLAFALNSIFADIGLNPEQLVVLAVLGVLALIAIVFFAFFLRLFGLWLQASMARANVSFLVLIGMMLRRTPMKELVRLKIMAVQADLSVSTRQIEVAVMQGADVERAVLAMIRAREIGKEVTWQEVIAEDANERLRKKLYEE